MAIKQQQEEDVKEKAVKTGQEGMGPALIASAASVGLSWYYFFGRQNKEMGLFVGLWAPTILAFASYFNQRRMRRQLEAITQPGTTIKNAIDSVMKNR